MRKIMAKWIAKVALSVLVLTGGAAMAADVNGVAKSAAGKPQGNTAPFRAKELTLKVSGEIKKIHVKEGDVVKAGDPLFELDTEVEELEAAALKIEAESNLPIDAAVKNKAVKDAEFKRQDDMFKRGVAAMSDWEKAKADAELAVLQIDKAKEDQMVAKVKYQRQLVLIKQMKRLSPTAGIVASVDRHEGEVLDPTKPVVTMVVTDPLKVVVWMPTKDAQKLKVGASKMMVKYTDLDEPAREATLYFRSPVANAGAGMQQVWFSLPNPDARDAGLSVTVEPVTGVAAGQ